MWESFWNDFVPEATRDEPFAFVHNGDAVEGIHHGATTQISHNLDDQRRLAEVVLRPIIKRSVAYYHIRGTEAHVGQSAQDEEQLARALGAVPSTEKQHARYDLWIEVGGALVHLLHHIGTTGSQAYEATAVHKELVEEYSEAARWSRRPPDCLVRSHRHRYLQTRIPTARGHAIAVVTPGWQGKMLALDTPLPTPEGWTTMGEVRPGDTLFDEKGKPCMVITVLPIDKSPESYVVGFSNGESVKACGDHLWLTTANVDKPGVPGGRRKRPLSRVRTTREIRDTLLYGKNRDKNHRIPMPEALVLPEAELPIDPYVLGCWLGDGDSDCARMTLSAEDADTLAGSFEKAKTRLSRQKQPLSYALRKIAENGEPLSKNDPANLQIVLRRENLLRNKHIPSAYLRASFSQRLSLLQGLMDTDGYAENRGRVCEFCTTLPSLRDGTCELLATLGIKYSCVEGPSFLRGQRCKNHWKIRFFISPDKMPVFRLPRKLDRIPLASSRRYSQRSRATQIVSVEPCDPVPMRCIAVDSESHLYRFGRTMLPTHNSPFAWKVAGGRLTTPQFGGIVIRWSDEGELYVRDRVWTVERSETEKVSL
jgi:hypothetical protein